MLPVSGHFVHELWGKRKVKFNIFRLLSFVFRYFFVPSRLIYEKRTVFFTYKLSWTSQAAEPITFQAFFEKGVCSFLCLGT